MLNAKIISLGCAKNLVDSEVMAGMLKDKGFNLIDVEEAADILVVNTCGFINAAKEESINAIMETAQYKKTGRCKALIVTGCLAQRYRDELLSEIPEIDGLIGTGEIPRILNVVEDAIAGKKTSHVAKSLFIYDHLMPRVLSTPSYSAYVKVAEGCDNRCTYCAIPEIRGNYRSRNMDSIIAEVQSLVGQGVKEINLIAQDTTRYGEDLYGVYKLDELLSAIGQIEDLSWIRVLYAYPTHFTDTLIDVIAHNDKVCKYLDIPLQHADDEILQAMNRQGNATDITALLEKLRRSIPGLVLRTSFIVGFPGETEEKFQTLIDFVKNMQFDKVGVFTYSPEEGTPAELMSGQVPEEIKDERRDRLMRIQQDISLEKNNNKVGEVFSVLIEGKDETEQEVYIGRTEADAPEVDGSIFIRGQSLVPGDIVQVRITHAYEYDLIGEVIA